MTLNSVVLPAPFGPISPVTRLLLDAERDLVERLEAAEADPDLVDLEQRHVSSPASGRARRPSGADADGGSPSPVVPAG